MHFCRPRLFVFEALEKGTDAHIARALDIPHDLVRLVVGRVGELIYEDCRVSVLGDGSMLGLADSQTSLDQSWP
jgi:hypothetical protein